MTLIRTRRQLKLALGVFVVALGVPALVLVLYSYQQLQWEAFHQQRLRAQELSQRINQQVSNWLQVEEQRSFADYQFLIVAGDPTANYFQPSPLASVPPAVGLPGVIGFFQVDANGQLTSPVLPSSLLQANSFGISDLEFNERIALFNELQTILSENQLVPRQQVAMDLPRPRPESLPPSSPPSSSPSSQGLASAESPAASSYAVSNSREAPAEQREADAMAPVTSEPFAAQADRIVERAFREETVVGDAAHSGRDAGFDRLLEEEVAEPAKMREAEEKRLDIAALEKTKKQSLNDVQREKKSEQTAAARPRAPEPKSLPTRSKRIEQSVLPSLTTLSNAMQTPAQQLAGITMFESEIDPFVFRQLKSGHLVLFRKVWQDGGRLIQGVLLTPPEFLHATIVEAFRSTELSRSIDLVIAYRHEILQTVVNNSRTSYLSAAELQGELLLQSELAAPFNDIALVYLVRDLQPGAGLQVVMGAGLIMILVLLSGALSMYFLGLRQLRLVQQQQDFISAVSHELKTPLTSIRMYGELLKQGWASEEKRQEYYDYIFSESERLSRLIANVLQLARMNRRDWQLNLRPTAIAQLTRSLKSKLQDHVQQAGFTLDIQLAPELETSTINVDEDSVLQIFINLVDNALKFSAQAERKQVDIRIASRGNDFCVLSVRDYGPGIEKSQMRKIFGLFYRAENEMTRKTIGTGIGLALAQQLAKAMLGRIEVVNLEPGAEFRLVLPTLPASVSAD